MRLAIELVIDGRHVVRAQRSLANSAAEACLVEGFVAGPNELHRIHSLSTHGTL